MEMSLWIEDPAEILVISLHPNSTVPSKYAALLHCAHVQVSFIDN